jgi:Beta-ketoacyl synthase, N-terminal domain
VNSLAFKLHAAGVLAPGLDSLAQLRAACRAGRSIVPAPLLLPSPAMLPTHERRRASQVVRLVLACIDQALAASPFPAQDLRSVFATDEGTGEVCQQMLESLATTRQVSPLLFPNSVHNAPSGYFSIAWRNRQPATVVSLGLESFASGLLCAVTEAAASGQPTLLVAYDPAMTSPLDELLPVTQSTSTAWIIGCGLPEEAAPVLGSFTVALEPAGTQAPSPLPSWLASNWAVNSSARSLAALGLLEADPGTACRLTLGGQLLTLRCTPGAQA